MAQPVVMTPVCYKDIDINSFFSCQTRLLCSLPAKFLTFLLNVFLIDYLSFLLLFRLTLCLAVAVQSCEE